MLEIAIYTFYPNHVLFFLISGMIMIKTNLGNLHSPFDDIKKSSQLQNSPNMGIFYAQLLMSSAQNNHVSCGTSTKNLI